MNKAEIIRKLKEIIISSMEISKLPDDIEGIDMITGLGINSVDALEILVWVENTFQIQIPDEDLNADLLRSVDNLANYVISKREVANV
jgi:acyl carrier protein